MAKKTNVEQGKVEQSGWASDPVCGECLKPLSKHDYVASMDRYFCEPAASYEYSTEPLESAVMEVIEAMHPGIYEEAAERWKRENGHLPNDLS